MKMDKTSWTMDTQYIVQEEEEEEAVENENDQKQVE